MRSNLIILKQFIEEQKVEYTSWIQDEEMNPTHHQYTTTFLNRTKHTTNTPQHLFKNVNTPSRPLVIPTTPKQD